MRPAACEGSCSLRVAALSTNAPARRRVGSPRTDPSLPARDRSRPLLAHAPARRWPACLARRPPRTTIPASVRGHLPLRYTSCAHGLRVAVAPLFAASASCTARRGGGWSSAARPALSVACSRLFAVSPASTFARELRDPRGSAARSFAAQAREARSALCACNRDARCRVDGRAAAGADRPHGSAAREVIRPGRLASRARQSKTITCASATCRQRDLARAAPRPRHKRPRSGRSALSCIRSGLSARTFPVRRGNVVQSCR